MMVYAINRGGRAAVVVGFVSALFVVAPTLSAAASNNNAELQLAQAAPSTRSPAEPPDQQSSRQVTDLQKKLQITPAQQPQFDAFVQVMRQNGEAIGTAMQAAQRSKNALDALRAQIHVAETQADGLKRLQPVFEKFYASLSEQQKRTADELFGPPRAQPRQRR